MLRVPCRFRTDTLQDNHNWHSQMFAILYAALFRPVFHAIRLLTYFAHSVPKKKSSLWIIFPDFVTHSIANFNASSSVNRPFSVAFSLSIFGILRSLPTLSARRRPLSAIFSRPFVFRPYSVPRIHSISDKIAVLTTLFHHIFTSHI